MTNQRATRRERRREQLTPRRLDVQPQLIDDTPGLAHLLECRLGRLRLEAGDAVGPIRRRRLALGCLLRETCRRTRTRLRLLLGPHVLDLSRVKAVGHELLRRLVGKGVALLRCGRRLRQGGGRRLLLLELMMMLSLLMLQLSLKLRLMGVLLLLLSGDESSLHGGHIVLVGARRRGIHALSRLEDLHPLLGHALRPALMYESETVSVLLERGNPSPRLTSSYGLSRLE